MANQAFDDGRYLTDMYNDNYYPRFLVDKVKALIAELVTFLEAGTHTKEEIQAKFDVMTIGINDLQEEFWDNDSEIETVARESIGQTVEDILTHFSIDIDVEDAIAERDW